MSYRGEAMSGFAGHHRTLADLELVRPADDNVGRIATVGTPETSAIYHISQGNGWEPLVTAQTNALTGRISLSAGGSMINNAPSKNYLAFIPGRQFVTSGVPKDFSSNACDGVLGSALTDANLWATSGYMTTAVLLNGGVSLPLAKSTFNLGTESILFSVLLKKAAPVASDATFGNADTTTVQGFYLSCRVTSGKVRPVFNTSGGVVSALADSAAVFCDGTDHVLTCAFDSVTKQAFLWRDGCLSDTYTTGVTGTSTPTIPFYLGSNISLTAVAAQFSGVHLMKFTGGLPTNINHMVARLAAKPHDFLSDMDVKNA